MSIVSEAVGETPGIAPPEPDLTPSQMVARAQAMRAVLRQRQPLCEQLGRLPDETNQDFLRAGFYRILQPRRFGGYEFSVPDFIRVMLEVSRGCAESGWVLTLTSGHPATFLAAFPELGQCHAYGGSGDCRAPAVAVPGGVAEPVPNGYRLKGTWDYCSGCDIATHFLGAVTLRSQESSVEEYGYALFDRREFSIVDNWDVVGMQGTGSKRVVVDEVVVPPHRVLAYGDRALNFYQRYPGHDLHRNAMYRGPSVFLFACELATVAVGAGRGALDAYEEILRDKKWLLPPFQPRFEMPVAQHRFGHAQGLVDTAESALMQLGAEYVGICQRIVENDLRPTPEDERRFLRVAQQCINLAWEAVDLMFRTAGTSATRKTSPLARCFKNLAVIRTHLLLQFDQTSISAGRLHFGLSPR